MCTAQWSESYPKMPKNTKKIIIFKNHFFASHWTIDISHREKIAKKTTRKVSKRTCLNSPHLTCQFLVDQLTWWWKKKFSRRFPWCSFTSNSAIKSKTPLSMSFGNHGDFGWFGPFGPERPSLGIVLRILSTLLFRLTINSFVPLCAFFRKKLIFSFFIHFAINRKIFQFRILKTLIRFARPWYNREVRRRER